MSDTHCVTNHVATQSTVEGIAAGCENAPSQLLRDCDGCGRCELRPRRSRSAEHGSDAVSTSAAVGCSTSATDAGQNPPADPTPTAAGGASCDGPRHAA